ncbi:MAG: DUF4328 domain-containing protein [Thermodesulfobacteriota bacterium]
MNDPVPAAAYSHPRTPARLAVLLLGACALADVVALLVGWSEISLLRHVQAGGIINDAVAETVQFRRALIERIEAVLYAATVLFYLAWLYRVRRNLPALGVEDLRFSPGWTLGWWFVPIMNLFRPFQVVSEIWRASDPDRTGSLDWKEAPRSALLGLWWFFWLAAYLLGNVSLRLSTKATYSVADQLQRDWTGFFSDLAEIPAAILALAVVLEITRRQEEKHRRRG